MSLLSVVVPCYNEEAAIPFYYDAMKAVEADIEEKFQDLELEYIFIDDGSKDGTVRVIKELREKDRRVHFVAFEKLRQRSRTVRRYVKSRRRLCCMHGCRSSGPAGNAC